MNINLHKLSPEEHAANIAAIDKPQAWNPTVKMTDREVRDARFRALQVLDVIDVGEGGEARRIKLNQTVYN